MFYYWLVPVLLVAVIAVLIFAFGARRKANTSAVPEADSPDAIKRGRYINK